MSNYFKVLGVVLFTFILMYTTTDGVSQITRFTSEPAYTFTLPDETVITFCPTLTEPNGFCIDTTPEIDCPD